MKEEIKVPPMGESITEATIGQIIKEAGSRVEVDDELVELETDKVTQVLYAPKGGTFHLNVKPDDVVTIGQIIGHIDTEAAGAAPAPETAPEAPAEESAPAAESQPRPVAVQAPAAEPTAPAAPPSQSEGARVTKDAYIEKVVGGETPQPAPTPSPPAPVEAAPSTDEGRRETHKKMPKIRQVIARRLVEAQQSTAMLTTFNEVDMSPIMKLRSEHKDAFFEKHGVKLGFMSFFVKATVSALQAFPDINSYINGDELVRRWYYDVSIAVGTERGLIVPVIRNCDKLSFAGIEQAINGFASKARDGTITADDLQGGGFTITNGGVYGSLLSTPILNTPQSGILGMHKIEKRAVVVDNEIVIRPMMYLAMSYDHRVVDGKEAVSFLVHIKNILEDPSRLLLEV